jgi:acetyl esterase/lipase
MTVEANGPRATTAAESSPPDHVLEARRAMQRSMTDALRADFRHELGVAYGTHPRQVLDLYYPAAVTADAPVLVLLHGGGFRGGQPGFNGYHGRPYLERGSIFVSMGYRLAPDGVRFPDSCEDVELGLLCLYDHLAERGGDPDRLFLSGHSAGAMLAAAVGLRSFPAGLPLPPELIKGLVLISGMYNVAQHPEEIINRASPRYVVDLVAAVERVPAHTILIGGDQDFPAVLPDAQALQSATESRGGTTELWVEPNADHFAANRGFIHPASKIAQAVGSMMRLP